MNSSPVLKRAGKITWLIAICCVLVTFLTKTGTQPLTLYFLFNPADILHGEIWRLITPAFVHFVIMDSYIIHVLFNVLLWVSFAGGIEAKEGSWRLLALFLVSALFSNICAYLAYGPFFGGLSGVDYALVGYLYWRQRKLPSYHSVMPQNMLWPFLAFLVIGMTGLLGSMANIAHLSGLLSGVAFAAVMNWRDNAVAH